MTDYLKLAKEVAIKAHSGQKDKVGEDYINHVLYVSEGLKTSSEKIVGLLHDVIEDTSVTINDLITLGFSTEIIEALRAITRLKTESYNEYLRKVSRNEIAYQVKLIDMKHNSMISRSSNPTTEYIKKCKSYEKNLKKLKKYHDKYKKESF